MPFVYTTRIRFVDTDASGRIHFTAMLRYFEAGEQEFLRSIGLDFTGIHEAGIGFPRVHAECDYTGAVKYNDLVRIAVTVERVGATSYTLGFSASVEERPVAHGKLTIVCLDVATQRALTLPEEFAEKLKAGKMDSSCPPAGA